MKSFARHAEMSISRVAVLVRDVAPRIRAAWPSVKDGIHDPDLVAALEGQFARVRIMGA